VRGCAPQPRDTELIFNTFLITGWTPFETKLIYRNKTQW